MKTLIFVLYTIFLSSLTVFSYLFIDPNLLFLKNIYTGFIFSNRFTTSLLYVFLVLIYFSFYFLFLWMLSKKLPTKENVKWIIGLTCFILFFSYPAMLSYDIFNYILTAKVAFFYHENPYIIMPIAFVGDPLLLFTHAANKLALYGPFWLTITSIPHFLGFGNFILTLFSFKLIVLLFYLATVSLIYKMTKNTLSALIFALNPLVIIETLVSSHNDIVMMFLVLLAIYLTSRKKILLAFVFLLASIFIKYSTIILLPVFLYTLIMMLQKKTIDFKKIYSACWILMFVAFLASPLREEIYPWYGVWFLPFSALLPKSKMILYISIAFSFSLLLRYIPFMLLGTYASPTPFIKTVVTFIPVLLTLLYLFIKNKLWLKKLSLF